MVAGFSPERRAHLRAFVRGWADRGTHQEREVAYSAIQQSTRKRRFGDVDAASDSKAWAPSMCNLAAVSRDPTNATENPYAAYFGPTDAEIRLECYMTFVFASYDGRVLIEKQKLWLLAFTGALVRQQFGPGLVRLIPKLMVQYGFIDARFLPYVIVAAERQVGKSTTLARGLAGAMYAFVLDFAIFSTGLRATGLLMRSVRDNLRRAPFGRQMILNWSKGSEMHLQSLEDAKLHGACTLKEALQQGRTVYTVTTLSSNAGT